MSSFIHCYEVDLIFQVKSLMKVESVILLTGNVNVLAELLSIHL